MWRKTSPAGNGETKNLPPEANRGDFRSQPSPKEEERTLIELMNEIQRMLPPLNPEILQEALAELKSWAGKYHPTLKQPVYESQDDNVRRIQAKCWSYGLMLRRQAEQHWQEQRMTPEERAAFEAQRLLDEEKRLLQTQIDRDYEISALLMGLDNRFSQVSLYAENLVQTSVLRYFRDEFPYLDKRNCLVLGGTGSGKTFGVIGYVAQRANLKVYRDQTKSIDAKFITAYKLSELLYRKDFDKLDKLETVNYLIVDDLGAEPEGYKGKDFIAHFENLFTTRHMFGRATLITSNCKPEDIANQYGERFVSRFRETGDIFVSTDGDLRKRNAG